MKKVLLFISTFFFIFNFAYAKEFDITSKNVFLYNLNDNMILYEELSEEKTPIASLTKIMTSIVAIENIDNLEDKITISIKDFYNTDGYSKAGFKVGDNVTYLDLLYGILLPSGADAVNAIINNTLKDNFIDKMNELAKDIGLENTNFSNGIGKDDGNYSTAKDVAKLLNYALKNDTFKTIFTTREYTTTNGLFLKSTLVGYGQEFDTEKISGAKSGYTKNAGRCLASIATIDDVNYLLVVINSSKEEKSSAVKDSLTIYDYYSSNYSYQLITDPKKVIDTVKIEWSKEKEYNIKLDEEIKKYLKNDTSNNLTYVYEGIDTIKYKTPKNEKLGVIKVYNDNELLYEADALLLKDINYYNIPLMIIGGSICGVNLIVFLVIIMKRGKKWKF